MTPPGYQGILDADIPVVRLPDGAGTLRVIAGELSGREGSGADVHADQRLGRAADARHDATLDASRRAHGLRRHPDRHVAVNGHRARRSGDGPARSRRRRRHLDADSDAKLLVLTGEPIDEPIVAMARLS